MIGELDRIVEICSNDVDRLIKKKVRWLYSEHKHMTRKEEQATLEHLDELINSAKIARKCFIKEYQSALRHS
jgi:hypothetical protein